MTKTRCRRSGVDTVAAASPSKVHVSSLGSVLNVKVVKLGHFLKDREDAACENNKHEEKWKMLDQELG